MSGLGPDGLLLGHDDPVPGGGEHAVGHDLHHVAHVDPEKIHGCLFKWTGQRNTFKRLIFPYSDLEKLNYHGYLLMGIGQEIVDLGTG